MSTPVWQAGTVYLPGALVQPSRLLPVSLAALANPSFESDLAGWTAQALDGTALPSIRTDRAFTGGKAAWYAGQIGTCKPNGFAGMAGTCLLHWNDTVAPFEQGWSLSASGAIALDAPDFHASTGQVRVYWLDAAKAVIGFAGGNSIEGADGGAFRTSSLTATAPAGTRYARAAFHVTANGNGGVLYDSLSWSVAGARPPAGLIYKAVQPAAATSGTSEPVWPLVPGQQVNDGGVVWEAVQASRVVWKASPLYVSGAAEPGWPVAAGGTVADGTIKWVAISRRVEDPKCPNSKVVAIASGKVFAGDKDIVRFCATANPLDWSSASDAGYLPTGLQQNGANDVAVLNLYRGNLVVMNASTFQMWQVDPDPANMTLLDTIEGIGSLYQRAAQAVGNDLFFATPQGIRSVGIAASSTNLQAGDVGMPVDPLYREIAQLVPPRRSTYYPAMGQYWLAFGRDVLVYSMGQPGQPGAWSKYVLPWPADEFALLGGTLYVRHGNTIAAFDEGQSQDIDGATYAAIEGVVRWPFLDFGQPGTTKRVTAVDIVASGDVSIDAALDQSQDPPQFTPISRVLADSVPNLMIPFPAAAPSIMFQLRFNAAATSTLSAAGIIIPPSSVQWSLNAMNVYLQDCRSGT